MHQLSDVLFIREWLGRYRGIVLVPGPRVLEEPVLRIPSTATPLLLF